MICIGLRIGHAPLPTSTLTPLQLHSSPLHLRSNSENRASCACAREDSTGIASAPPPLPACGYTIQRVTGPTEIAAAPPVSTSPLEQRLERCSSRAEPRDNNYERLTSPHLLSCSSRRYRSSSPPRRAAPRVDLKPAASL